MRGKPGGRWGQGERQALGFHGGGVLGRGASSLARASWKKRERERGRRERGEKLLMVLLHDWAFVTAIALPAASARDTVARASQLVINHSRLITKEAASSHLCFRKA